MWRRRYGIATFKAPPPDLNTSTLTQTVFQPGGAGSTMFPTFLRKTNTASAVCMTCHNK